MERLLNWFKENLLAFLVGLILFFVPLYPKFPFYFVSDANVAVRIEDFLVAGAILVWLVKLYQEKRLKKLWDWPLARLFGIYFLAGFLSLISALLVTKNVVPHVAFLHFLRRIEYFLLFFVAYDSLKKTKIRQIRVYALVLGISTLGVLIYALGQKFYGWPVVSTMNREFAQGAFLRLSTWARVNSTFAGHYDLAAYLAMILVLSTAFLIGVKNKLVKLLIFLFWLFAFYILILTASRVSFTSYFISLIVLLVLLKRYRLIPFFFTISIVGMLLSPEFSQRYQSTFKISPKYLAYFSGLVKVKPKPPQPTAIPTMAPEPTPAPTLAVSPTPIKVTPTPTPTSTPTPAPEEPVEATELAVSRSTDIRFKVEWPRAIRAFAKNPLLGTGYSSITLATDNDYLRVLGETGILGVVSLFLIFAEIFRQAVVFLKKDKTSFEAVLVMGIMCASLAYFLNATFIDVFEASKLAFIFWILMGLMVKIIDLKET